MELNRKTIETLFIHNNLTELKSFLSESSKRRRQPQQKQNRRVLEVPDTQWRPGSFMSPAECVTKEIVADM